MNLCQPSTSSNSKEAKLRYSVARSNCITIKKFIIDIYRLHDIIKYGQLCPIQRLPITRRPDPRRYEYRASPPSSFPGMGHPLLAGGIRRRSNQPTIRAGGSRPPCGNISLCGHLEIVSKYTELTVERHYTRLLRAPRHWERVRCPPVIEAEAVAAMTSPEIGSE